MPKGARLRPAEVAWLLAAADIYGTSPQTFQQIQREHRRFFDSRKVDSLYQWYRKFLAAGRTNGRKSEAERCIQQHGGSRAYIEKIADAHLLMFFASGPRVGSTVQNHNIDAPHQVASETSTQPHMAMSNEQTLALIILQDYSPIYQSPISDFRAWILRLQSLQPKVQDSPTISKTARLIDILFLEIENLTREGVKEDRSLAGINALIHAANSVLGLTNDDLALLLLLGDGPWRMTSERSEATVDRLADLIKVSTSQSVVDKLSEYCLLLAHTPTDEDIRLPYEEPGR